MITRITNILKNKYYLTAGIFVVWMLFFDSNDVFTQIKRIGERNDINKDKTYYEKGIKDLNKDLKELTTNAKQLEKFARENYLMKKANEDIFIIVKKEEK